jgi:3-oxoacyl-[acyl-carrier protein] reductase
MDGLRVIVTGSATGLGAASAIDLAQRGARLVINYASSKREAEHTADQCRAAGAEVLVLQGDVSLDEDCFRLATAAATWGGLDALINNAGLTKHVEHGHLGQLSAEDFQRIYAVNTIGAFQMVRAARPLLETGATERKRASAVVNVSSIAGLTGVGSSLAYVASKGALNAMTIALARSLAPLIRVNAICPGYVDTPWFKKGRGVEGANQVRESIRRKVALRVASGPQDVAGLVTFLAGPRSGHMTGELVRMDAGMHLAN